MTKEYMNNKFVESLIYDMQIEPEKYTTKRKLNIDFLKKLNAYLKNEEINQRLDSKVKDRIYMLLDYIRFGMDKNKNLMYNREINEAIRTLNKLKDENCLIYYLNQLVARSYKSKNIIYIGDANYISIYYKKICYSISYDYQVLKNLRKSHDEYIKILPKYIGDSWFLLSVKGMFFENEKIFDDEILKENLQETITQNEKSDRVDEDDKITCNEIREKILKR